jgi:antitoxin component YwqK of YwqJK toxin-antitoxin module/tetratricopeptide (TPR) repeat protein
MRRLCPLFLVALFALCSLFSTAQEKNPLLQSGNLIDQASQLSDSGDYKKAIELYQRVDRNDTNYVRALYGISLSYYADSQFNMAMSYCKKAIALNKDASWEPDLYNQYGNSVDAAGDPQQAIRVYDSAIQKYPAHMLLYQNKGNLLMKLKRYPEAEAVLQKALLINPFAYTIHYKLAVCALAEGKLIPAFFSFIGYLVLTPEGRYHANAINVLSAISKNEDDIQKLVSERTEQPSENYQLLEQIVQSKIALDDNYKPVIRLDDKISRQIQVVFEKMQYQESDPDFWIQYYVPFYKSIFSDNQFEPFINYIFSTADLPIIKEYNKKNKKEISAFVDKAAVYFSLIRSSRELNLSRRNADSAAWIFSGGQLAGHGKYYQKGDKLVGPWEFYYGPGNIKARSAFDEQGRKMGPYTYYFVDGKVKGKEFYRDGKQEGEETYYFSNGLPSSHSWYKDGQPEGESVSYYFMGLPSAVSHYHAGKLDGVKVSFFSSGDSNLVEHYTAGVRSGEVRSWYQNRQADVMANYSNDKLDGAYKKYYPNGKLNTEGVYKAGKQEGPWKYYYPNGQLKSVINFANDKQEGDYKEFSDKGRLAVTYSFRKGKIDGEARYFDEDSVLYSTLQFDNDQLSKARYFDKKGKMINESTRNGKTINLTTFLPDCSKKSTLVYNEKSNIEGTEIFFYPSGKTYETDEYANGKEQGPSIVYYPDGVKKSETMYSGGQMDGYHRGYYSHGGVEQEGWYKDGSVAGYWLSYNEMGDLTDSAYYLNGDIEGPGAAIRPMEKRARIPGSRADGSRVGWTMTAPGKRRSVSS